MIVFDLTCDHWHRFEGWFASLEEFNKQKRKKLIACPVCNSQVVEKIPSGAKFNKLPSQREAIVERKLPQERDVSASAWLPVQTMNKLDELRKAIEVIMEKTEDVGRRFPEEARKIYYNEAPQRNIRGTATQQEAQELMEEGIEILVLPVTPRTDMH